MYVRRPTNSPAGAPPRRVLGGGLTGSWLDLCKSAAGRRQHLMLVRGTELLAHGNDNVRKAQWLFIRFPLPFLNSIPELSYATSLGHRFFSDQPN